MFKRKGFSLVEVMIAIGVLSTLILVMVDSTTDSKSMENDAKDLIIAELLADEANNIVRTLYLTNQLNFGMENEECWLALPNPAGKCSALMIGEENYIVDFDEIIVGVDNLLDEATGTFTEAYNLKLPAVEEEDEGEEENDILYSATDGGEASKYFRLTRLVPPNGENDDEGGLQVATEVGWLRIGEVPRIITRSMALDSLESNSDE